MTVYVSVELRRQLRQDAGSRRGYCRSAEELTGAPLTIEHILPISAGGPTARENLWLNNTYVVEARRFWVEAGRHPPSD